MFSDSGRTTATPNERYLAAIRALLSKGESDRSDLIDEIQNDAIAFRNRLWRQASPAPTCQKCAGKKQHPQETHTLNDSWDYEKSGLAPEDKVTLEHTPLDELRPDDWVWVIAEDNKTFVCASGKLKHADADGFTVEDWRGERTFNHEKHIILRIVSVLHTTIIERPADQPDAKKEREQQIRELRNRLENLGDEITASSKRFQLESEIYNLEREAVRDEWPEIVNA